MVRPGRKQWRWVIAGALITVLGLSIAFFLRTKGLGDAAEYAQLLSLLSLVAGLVGWARATKPGESDRLPDKEATTPSPVAADSRPSEYPSSDDSRYWQSAPAYEPVPAPQVRDVPTRRTGPYSALARGSRSRRQWLAWSAVLLVVIVAFIVPELGSSSGSDTSSALTVPPVTNLPVGKAVSILKAAGLVPSVTGFPCLAQLMPAGEVMESDPVDGEDISKGATIELYVCTAFGLPVPEVVGLPVASAIQQLGTYRFGYKIHYAAAPASEGIPTGVVWAQTPKAQSTYTYGGAVTLWVEWQAPVKPTSKHT